MDRRSLLKLLLAAGASPLAGGCRRSSGAADPEKGTAMSASQSSSSSTSPMPAIFLAHGSPLLLDDATWVEELAAWGRDLPRPKAILMISAHWVERPVTLGATRTVPLVYDFYGFPEKYYQITYASPGAPELARRVRELLASSSSNGGGVTEDPARGLDHGAYVPLVAMYPKADVPVLQISIPTMEPEPLLALGRALAPLRREGVLIVGSGFLTHNLRAANWRADPPTPTWAEEFDAWSHETLAKRDVDALLHYRERAPGVQMALPTHEHFVPVIVAMGASLGSSEAEAIRFPVTGFAYGSFTKRSVQFG